MTNNLLIHGTIFVLIQSPASSSFPPRSPPSPIQLLLLLLLLLFLLLFLLLHLLLLPFSIISSCSSSSSFYFFLHTTLLEVWPHDGRPFCSVQSSCSSSALHPYSSSPIKHRQSNLSSLTSPPSGQLSSNFLTVL